MTVLQFDLAEFFAAIFELRRKFPDAPRTNVRLLRRRLSASLGQILNDDLFLQ
jgi:hypothetical protein